MFEYKFVRFFSSRQIGCVTNGGYPIPFRSVLYGLYRGWVIVPIDICYNRDGPRLVATPMIRQGDSLRPHIKDRRVLLQVSAALQARPDPW